jgi:lysophospholipase L1-like esterase
MKALERKPSRRNFLKQASALSASSFAVPTVLQELPLANNLKGGEHYSFLFQGDSITDGNRSRNMDWNHVLGHGYAYLIAANLLYRFPQKNFQFYNRGVSGNQVTDLMQRWSEDTIALKPDLLSILIGVNDTLNEVSGNKNATAAGFENDYRLLLTDTRRQLPEAELVICEPFILPVGKVKDQWNDFQKAISGRQEAARRIAAEFGATYIPLQDYFNQSAAKFPPDAYWLWDGIHPMPNGHELIAREWIKQVSRKIKFISWHFLYP